MSSPIAPAPTYSIRVYRVLSPRVITLVPFAEAGVQIPTSLDPAALAEVIVAKTYTQSDCQPSATPVAAGSK